VRLRAGYEEILQENKRFSGQNSLLDLFKSPPGTVVSPAVLLDTGDDDPYGIFIVVA
jgi:hypothetical protein